MKKLNNLSDRYTVSYNSLSMVCEIHLDGIKVAEIMATSREMAYKLASIYTDGMERGYHLAVSDIEKVNDHLNEYGLSGIKIPE